MKDKLAPILLFVFNRPANTKKTLQALKNNNLADQSLLYIYADGPKSEVDEIGVKSILEVREIIKEQQWCKEVQIIEADRNKGLANSIIDGVTEKVNQHGKVIVLEDDLVTSRGFLQYMNEALNKYEKEESVMQISGHQFPINLPTDGSSFFLSMTTSWGWATWKRAWQHFDFFSLGYEQLRSDQELSKKFNLNGSFPYSNMLFSQIESKSIDSWAIRWWWSVFSHQGISLFPDNSLVQNIGYGNDASHTTGRNPFHLRTFMSDYYIHTFPDTISQNDEYALLVEGILRTAQSRNKGFIHKFLSRCKHLFYLKKNNINIGIEQ